MLGLCEHRSRRVRRFAGTQHFYVSYITLLAAAGTIEEQAGTVMLSRLIASATSTDADASTFSEVARVFGIDWIPAVRLAEELS